MSPVPGVLVPGSIVPGSPSWCSICSTKDQMFFGMDCRLKIRIATD
jgi:hypothetical protein